MGLEELVYFAIALVPGLAWLFVLALRYAPDRETRWVIVKTFILGMAICTPAGFFNTWLIGAVGGPSGGLTSLLVFVLIVGPNEETLKFLVVWSEGYRRWRFRSEMDGIVLATASAIGFATYENAHYMQMFGIQVLALRAWACVIAHLSFSAIFGYYLGLAKAKKYNTRLCVAEGLALAALFHGLYDFAVGLHDHALYVVVPLLAGYYFMLIRGKVRPILSILAPEALRSQPPESHHIEFRKRRFQVQRDDPSAKQVLEALEWMEGIDDEGRLSGVATARSVLDQRLFERVGQLTHDPVDRVREAAIGVHKELKRRLRDGGPTGQRLQ